MFLLCGQLTVTLVLICRMSFDVLRIVQRGHSRKRAATMNSDGRTALTVLERLKRNAARKSELDADRELMFAAAREIESMLAALDDMVDMHDIDVTDGTIKTEKGSERWRRVEAARAAIAKATGGAA